MPNEGGALAAQSVTKALKLEPLLAVEKEAFPRTSALKLKPLMILGGD